MSEPSSAANVYVLFVYGTLLPGEASHALLSGARALGAGTTSPAYELIDLGAYPALVAGGSTAVHGALYEVGAAALAAIDVHEGHPILFKRAAVKLADGREAQGYLLDPDQVRGRRRIRGGDWRRRFEPAPRARRSP